MMLRESDFIAGVNSELIIGRVFESLENVAGCIAADLRRVKCPRCTFIFHKIYVVRFDRTVPVARRPVQINAVGADRYDGLKYHFRLVQNVQMSLRRYQSVPGRNLARVRAVVFACNVFELQDHHVIGRVYGSYVCTVYRDFFLRVCVVAS